MNPKEVDRFFQAVAKAYPGKATVYLTGAAAGALMGNIRPSLDIDFGVVLKNRQDWDTLSAAIGKAKTLSGVAVNFDEDIDRWGMITLMDYPKHSRVYKTFGGLTVKLLDPATWSIGKMTRFLDPDARDMAAVLKKQKVTAAKVAGVWGKALKASPRSEAQNLFRKQVEYFLKSYGPGIWGKGFDSEKAVGIFRRAAGIREPKNPGTKGQKN